MGPVDLWEMRRLAESKSAFSVWVTPPVVQKSSVLFREFAAGRDFLFRLLVVLARQSSADHERWYDINRLLKLIWRLNPDLYHFNKSQKNWGWSRGGSLFVEKSVTTWIKTTGRLVRDWLEGPCFWLGLVELRQRDGKTTSLRITPAGRWYLLEQYRTEALPPSGPQRESVCTWQKDGSLYFRPGHDSRPLRELIAQLMRVDRQRLYHFVPDEEKMVALCRKGVDPASLASDFDKAGIPLPPALLQQITTLRHNFGRVHLYQSITLMEFSDPYALSELRAAKIILPHQIIHEFSPQLIVIQDHAVEFVVKNLRNRAYTPRIIEKEEAKSASNQPNRPKKS
jgi:hypothetical protein